MVLEKGSGGTARHTSTFDTCYLLIVDVPSWFCLEEDTGLDSPSLTLFPMFVCSGNRGRRCSNATEASEVLLSFLEGSSRLILFLAFLKSSKEVSLLWVWM